MHHQWYESAVDALRKPEWIAAVALLIQAVILFLQYKILGRHANTMERHTEIADTQAKTAESIGKALEQQGKVLGDQTKIMEEQLEFQKTVDIRAEKVQILDCLMQLQIDFRQLLSTLLQVQLANYTTEMQVRVTSNWSRIAEDLVRCSKILQTSMYINRSEREYFWRYIQELTFLEQTSDIRDDIEKVKAFAERHKDFTGKMFAAGKATT